jgi:pyridoxine 5-phosphate synthase
MPFVAALREAGIRVSLFIDPDPAQIEAAHAAGADAVELHTGTYCLAFTDNRAAACREELHRLQRGAALAAEAGLEVHAGHGLDYDNVLPVAAIPQIVELNIGHFLVGEAVFIGLAESVRRMRAIMDEARAGLRQSGAQAEARGAR